MDKKKKIAIDETWYSGTQRPLKGLVIFFNGVWKKKSALRYFKDIRPLCRRFRGLGTPVGVVSDLCLMGAPIRPLCRRFRESGAPEEVVSDLCLMGPLFQHCLVVLGGPYLAPFQGSSLSVDKVLWNSK